MRRNRRCGIAALRDLAPQSKIACAIHPPCLKNCTARSCCMAWARLENVPRLRRRPVRGFFLRENNRYFPDESLRIMVRHLAKEKSEIRDQRSEVRGQRSEIRCQRSVVSGQSVRGQRSEVRSQKLAFRSQQSMKSSMTPMNADECRWDFKAFLICVHLRSCAVPLQGETLSHSAFSTQYSALSTQHSALSTQHSALSTQHSALSTQYFTPPTVHTGCAACGFGRGRA